VAGIGGSFRIVRTNTRGVKGSGPNGEVGLTDLFDITPKGLRPKEPGRVTQDITSKNKWLKRGLAYLMHRSLSDHGGTHLPADITAAGTTWPLNAMVLVADKWNVQPPSGPPYYNCDARGDWSEPDGASNVVIPPADNPTTPRSPAGQGRRGLDLDVTTGILKRVSTAYIGTAPYREGEFVVYAQPNDISTTKATGTITTIAEASLLDTEWFELWDGMQIRRFEFDKTSPGSFTFGNHRIPLAGGETADQVRDLIIAAINAQDDDELMIDAASGGAATVNLTHRYGGYIGNVTHPTDGVANAGFVLSVMAGGVGVERDDNEIDNLAIKGIGLTANVDAGAGEANSLWAVRSVIGLLPTFQGDSDRQYEHEGKALHKYVAAETVAGVGLDGYVMSGDLAEVSIDTITPNVLDSIASNVMVLTDAVDDCTGGQGFTVKRHFRKRVKVTGGNNNGKEFTIKKILSPTSFETWEAMVDEAAPTGVTSVEIVEDYDGMNVFDGRVENEGRIDGTTADDDPYGRVQNGEKWVADAIGTSPDYAWVGRVWPTAKKIRGVRICAPVGVPRDAVPNKFKIQYLDSGLGDEPFNTAHWTTYTSGDFSTADEGTDIFEAGLYGKEYTFPDTLPFTKGVRIVGIQAIDTGTTPQVAALMIFTDWDPSGTGVQTVAGSDDRLDLATDGVPNYRRFDIGSVGPTQDVQDFVDAINAQVRGWQLEAIRSRFGFLWLRGTVAGNNSDVDLDNPAGNANAILGLPTSPTQRTGLSQWVRKLPPDALTIIYRFSLSGDLPT
jgi:hypothetical protein